MEAYTTDDEEDDGVLASDLDQDQEEDSDLTSEGDDENQGVVEPLDEELLLIDEPGRHGERKSKKNTGPEEKKMEVPLHQTASEVVTDELFQQYIHVLHKPPTINVSLRSRMTEDSQKQSIMATIAELILARGFTSHRKPQVPIVKGVNVITAYNKKDKWLVIFYVSSKLSIHIARDIHACLEQYTDHVAQVVVVTAAGVTSVAKHTLSFENLQVFEHTELVVNYTKHKLVPDQKALSRTETDKVLHRYHLKKSQLPTMARYDPIAKFYGWTPGTVIRCTKRLGQAMEEYISYRVVR